LLKYGNMKGVPIYHNILRHGFDSRRLHHFSEILKLAGFGSLFLLEYKVPVPQIFRLFM